MRLGQLARKIAIKPSELVDFLSTKGIPAESGINTRLDTDHIQLIVQSLAPGKLAEITNEVITQEEPEVVEQVNLVEPITIVEETPLVINISEIPEIPVPARETKTETEEAEIIKAPKVELQGLKVLGKIELPELKKKEPANELPDGAEPATIISENRTPPSVRKALPQRRERTEQRPAKNPIALKREQEAMEAEQKRKERAGLEKEKRTQNYLKRVKSAPTKAMKRIDEQVTEVIEDEVEAPKTWLGKLFRWFKS